MMIAQFEHLHHWYLKIKSSLFIANQICAHGIKNQWMEKKFKSSYYSNGKLANIDKLYAAPKRITY